ncbi:hypothetical protein [Mycolicibacterium hodleri]|uniref:hypothetical protein n=1 Tax=Mycolicibacterium hodleri TaxID=49897 RepID=UPI003D1605AA
MSTGSPRGDRDDCRHLQRSALHTARRVRLPRDSPLDRLSLARCWVPRGGAPLVHHVPAARRGAASVPFAALVEAFVLRALRNEVGIHQTSDRRHSRGRPGNVWYRLCFGEQAHRHRWHRHLHPSSPLPR